ncbi:MAG: stage II sporulation protein P [Ruminococcus sp.]|nr:stage II sporulation protein P [Ruminococcus sp.]
MRYRLKSVLCIFVAVILVALGSSCLWTRLKERMGSREVMLTAAALSMPDGELSIADSQSAAESNSINNREVSTISRDTSKEVTSLSSQVYKEDPEIYAEKKHYPVLENQYQSGDLGYNDFFVKNTTDYNLNIGELLERPLGFDFEQNGKVQVLIVHTHTCESYLTYDAGYYHEGFYPRSEDPERNMTRVGKAIEEGLKQQGIGVVHATEVHDSPKYDGAYYRSWDTIEKYLEEYPDIKVVLDIHRDSISYGSEGGKVKPTFTHNGKKAAQIMIMAGYDGDGYYDFPFWKDNLAFALKLQDTAETLYPGMTRPLYFGDFVYNMNINNGSLLIEVGTDANTLEEAVYTGELLSNVLAKVLQSS